MTATLPAPATPAAPRAAASAASARPAGRVRRVLLDTPRKLWAVAIALVLLSLAWGVVGGLVASQHSSAADSVATRNEQLALDARHLYQSIADADATITAAFLASNTPPLNQLQRYQGDIATAHTQLSDLQAAVGNDTTAGPALATISSGLSDYTADIGQATAEYALGYPLTGGSTLQVASSEAHLTLLPAANTVFTRQNDQLGAANDQATGLPTMIALLVLAVVTGVALFRAQRWLTRRTHRVLSPGLLLASLALCVSVVWVLAAFIGGRSDLDNGISHGSGPAQNLALASIGVQQIRGDSVLNVISRSGSSSFAENFAGARDQVNTWLSAANAAQPNAGDASLVSTAQRDATAWYADNEKVYAAGDSSNYAAESTLVVGAGPGTTGAGYSTLETDFTSAINADQQVFANAASRGASLLDPLTEVIAAAAVVMALGCGWAISRRIAEYR
jgi:predicted PurR-regulated permease PerM